MVGFDFKLALVYVNYYSNDERRNCASLKFSAFFKINSSLIYQLHFEINSSLFKFIIQSVDIKIF